jgi:type I restriction enzyme R subunit
MNLALAQYNKTDEQNFEDIAASVVVVKDHLDLLRQLFHKFNSDDYFNGDSVAQLACLNRASEYALATEKIEQRFMGLVKRLKSACDICCGSESLDQRERDEVHFYLAVRSIVFKLTKGNAPDAAQMNKRVREMIAEALKSDGVEEIIQLGESVDDPIDLFDEDYLEKLKKLKLPNTRIKLLQQLLAKAIADFKKGNLAKGVDFSKQFKAIVDKYNERKEDSEFGGQAFDDITNEMVDLIGALAAEKGSYADLGIDFEEKSFYDILKKLALDYNFTYPEDKLIALAKAVKSIVDDKAKYTDWSERDDIKAELKVDLILVLAKHGYPPVDKDEVYKQIFLQAENFKKHRS